MTSRLAQGAALALVLSAVMAAGCAKRPATAVAPTRPPSGTPGALSPGPAPTPAAPEQPARYPPGQPTAAPHSAATSRPAPGEFTAVADLRDIHFDFDRYAIRSEDRKILEANATWLKDHPTYHALIEGHCDERGTNEYNLALGERRAKAAMNYLVSVGVAASRIGIVSYGEERPLCTDKAESCWSQNRRAHFLVKPM